MNGIILIWYCFVLTIIRNFKKLGNEFAGFDQSNPLLFITENLKLNILKIKTFKLTVVEKLTNFIPGDMTQFKTRVEYTDKFQEEDFNKESMTKYYIWSQFKVDVKGGDELNLSKKDFNLRVYYSS